MREIKTVDINYKPDDFWNLLKRNCSTEELITLNRNIIACNGLKASDNKANLVDGLVANPEFWTQHWVVISNIFGIGYQDSKGILRNNKINEYISTHHGDIKGFYLFWTFFFQYPYGKKHSQYYKNEQAVHPIILVIEHLKLLFESALMKGENPFEEAYITSDEFALIVTKIRNNSVLEVSESVSRIILNRKKAVDYSNCYIEKPRGSMQGLFNYVQAYYKLSPLIECENGSFKINSWHQYYKICNLLNFKKDPIAMKAYKEREVLNEYLSENIKMADVLKKEYEYLDSVGKRLDNMDENNIARKVSKDLQERGVYFETEFIESFLLSLKTKPFLILSGISGVGKSLLPNMIMELSQNESCKPIAVAPNWVDNTDMLGYFDLEDNFIMGDFTRVVLDAVNHTAKPFFLILDEMNLAKVELYFAQVLSCIESRFLNVNLNSVEYKNPLFNKSYRDRFHEKSMKATHDEEREIYEKLSTLTIPNNLYIIGTVNIDESTHPFSKKVLDRANVIEINDVDLNIGMDFIEELYVKEETEEEAEEAGAGEEAGEEAETGEEAGAGEEAEAGEETEQPEEEIIIVNSMLEGKITNFKELTDLWARNVELLEVLPLKESLQIWIEELNKFNAVLKVLKQNFGLRTRDEVCIYLYHSAKLNYLELSSNKSWWYRYFDQQLIQKVLTRVEGEAEEITNVLKSLFNLCSYSNTYDDPGEIVNSIIVDKEKFKYPNAAKKIQSMLKELIIFDKPATTFWSV
ncbi:McrB family protein [Bacillus cereus]|uniref:McrB family protein n=2 Tax=Bacteria TaxID=2 RepID=UPI00112460FC|nr:hypothetical protein [Bacillus cereus]TNO85929.1 hypothetical protein FHR08_27750 [Bacillus cereus]